MDLEPLLRPFLIPGLLILETQHSERQYHIGVSVEPEDTTFHNTLKPPELQRDRWVEQRDNVHQEKETCERGN
jgi:hypothetical protein